MAELSVQIGADIKDLLKKLDLTEKQLLKLDKISAKSGKAIASTGSTAAKGVDALNKSTVNALPATQEFSRIIQDAPYGIQGVANNIQQLTSQFGYLSTKAGGALPALKAMGASLIGPAGLLFAVSAVTSILVTYGDEIANVIKGNTELEASQKAVNEALQEFYGGSVATLNSYISILEDVNTTEAQRINITDELISKVPSLTKADFDYGNNLDTVKEKIGQYVLAQASRIEADTLVSENSKKLEKTARIAQINSIKDQKERVKSMTAFLKEEGIKATKTEFKDGVGLVFSDNVNKDFAKEVAKTGDEITKDFNTLADRLETDLAPVQKRINELYGITFGGGLNEASDNSVYEGLVKKQSELKKQFEELAVSKGTDASETKAVAKEYAALTTRINAVKSALDALNPKEKKVKDTSKADAALAEKRRVMLLSIEDEINNEIYNKAESTFSKVNAIFEASGAKLQDAFDGDYIGIEKVYKNIVDLDTKISELVKNFKGLDLSEIDFKGLDTSQLDDLSNKFSSLQKEGEIFTDAVSSSVSTLADEISTSLSTGIAVVDSFISSIIGSLAKLLAQEAATAIAQKGIAAGQIATNQAVATSNAIVGATASGAATGAAAVFTTPGFLIGMLALVGGAFAAIGSFAKGGFSGDDNLAFLNKNELVLRPQEQAALYNAIRGKSLGSLSSGNNRDSNSGGVVGNVVLRGQDQIVQLRRADKKYKRYYN